MGFFSRDTDTSKIRHPSCAAKGTCVLSLSCHPDMTLPPRRYSILSLSCKGDSRAPLSNGDGEEGEDKDGADDDEGGEDPNSEKIDMPEDDDKDGDEGAAEGGDKDDENMNEEGEVG